MTNKLASELANREKGMNGFPKSIELNQLSLEWPNELIMDIARVL